MTIKKLGIVFMLIFQPSCIQSLTSPYRHFTPIESCCPGQPSSATLCVGVTGTPTVAAKQQHHWRNLSVSGQQVKIFEQKGIFIATVHKIKTNTNLTLKKFFILQLGTSVSVYLTFFIQYIQSFQYSISTKTEYICTTNIHITIV